MEVKPISMKKLVLKQCTLSDEGWFLHRVNSLVHTDEATQLWVEEYNIQVIPHPPTHLTLPQQTPAYFQNFTSCFLVKARPWRW